MSDLQINKKMTLKGVCALLHIGDSNNAIGHMNYWHKLFLNSKVKILFLVRSLAAYKKLLSKSPYLPLAYAKSPLDVESLVTQLLELNVIFYSGNTGNNIHLLRFNAYKHIFIGSEHSERLSSIGKFRRAYDSIWISAEAEKNRYREAGIGDFDFVSIGSPKIRHILEQKKNTGTKDKKEVLVYLNNHNLDKRSINISGDILRALDTHTNRSASIHVHVATPENELKILEKNYHDLFYNLQKHYTFSSHSPSSSIHYQFVILDVHSMNLEILALDCPIILYYPEDLTLNTQSTTYYHNFEFCYNFSTIQELKNIIAKLIDHPLSQTQKEIFNAIAGYSETLNNTFHEALVNEGLAPNKHAKN